MNGMSKVVKTMAERGFLADYEQKARQEGELKRQQEIFALLDKGYSVEEVKRKLQPA
jgi:hypothetical protein